MSVRLTRGAESRLGMAKMRPKARLELVLAQRVRDLATTRGGMGPPSPRRVPDPAHTLANSHLDSRPHDEPPG